MPVSLAELLQEPVQSVIRRERDTLEELLRSRSNRVVLFGSGNLGRKAVGALQEIGDTPLAFSDNNQKRWGTALENTPILPPKEAAALYGSNAVFLVTIWNEFHWFCETKQQLTGYGCDSVIPYSFLHWRFPDTFLPCLLNDLPNKLYRERDLILKAADIWADPASRDLFEANIRLRALGEFDGIPGRSVENTYLPLDLIQLSASDRFLDCGATGGEMLRDLINKRGEEFALFCALEADNISFPTLETCRDSLSTNLQTKLRLYNCAVGAERQVVRFAHSGLTGSRISEEGLPVIGPSWLSVSTTHKTISGAFHSWSMKCCRNMISICGLMKAMGSRPSCMPFRRSVSCKMPSDSCCFGHHQRSDNGRFGTCLRIVAGQLLSK